MTDTTKNAAAQEEIDRWLRTIDDHQVEASMPVRERPLNAAMFMVKEGIVRGSGEDPAPNDEIAFVRTSWFAVFYNVVERWYCSRYGAVAIETMQQTVPAALFWRGEPYALTIPITHLEAAGPEEAWISMPLQFPGESAWDLVDAPPPAVSRTLEAEELVRQIARDLRGCSVLMMMVGGKPPEASAVAAQLRTHLSAAGRSLQSRQYVTSVWHAHQVAELSLKTAIWTHGARPLRTHELADLVQQLERASDEQMDEVSTSKLPSCGEAIGCRTGETDVAPQSAFAYYVTAISFSHKILGKIKYRYDFRRASFKIRRPLWFSVRDGESIGSRSGMRSQQECGEADPGDLA